MPSLLTGAFETMIISISTETQPDRNLSGLVIESKIFVFNLFKDVLSSLQRASLVLS